MKLLRKISFFIFILAVFSCSTTSSGFFESIAKRKLNEIPGLVNNEPPRLSNNSLSWDNKVGKPFKTANKIDTQEELEKELVIMRDKYRPFLSNLAPKIVNREKLELVNFDFRYAKKNEIEDNSKALLGDGEWENRQIPHYGGPTGESVSFYRKELTLSNSILSKKRLFIHFQGVDYYTDLFVNGTYVGFHEGLFDSFEFDIKPFVKQGKNTILVRVANDGCPIGTTPIYGGQNFRVGPKMAASGGPGWDDPYKGWICTPVGYGLWQTAWLEARDDFFINDVFVNPDIENSQVEVWVEVGGSTSSLNNKTLLSHISANFSIYGQNFLETIVEQSAIDINFESDFVNLFESPQPKNGSKIEYSVKQFKFTVKFDKFRLWDMDAPWLYQIQIRLNNNKKEIDAQKKQFGMRSFVQSVDSSPKGRFYLNGKQIRLRGANMMGNIMQCVIRKDYDQLIDDILLAKIANMNFWRMTQQPCQPEAYDYFDRLGLMAQSDLPTFAYIPKTQDGETLREAGALMRMVRSHPSNVMISYINEPMIGKIRELPRLTIAETALVFEQCDALIPSINPNQVVKWVDGDYANMSRGYCDHHTYNLWYWKHAIQFSDQYNGAWVKTRKGWMHGCGEYGSEGVDSVELMRKYYPKEWLGESKEGDWSAENIPCQSNRPAFKRWIGEPKSLEDFSIVSREHQRVATRLQVEAFRRDPKMNSTALHLLIDAWPAGWLKTVVDYDRQAKPSYFEFLDAQTPLAVNLRPDSFFAYSGKKMKIGTWICNDVDYSPENSYLQYNLQLDGKIIKTGKSDANIINCEPIFQGWLEFKAPNVNIRKKLILTVALFSQKGELLHDRKIELELLPIQMRRKKGTRPGGLWQFLIES